MKKTLIFLTLIVATSFAAKSQCILVQDTVTAGENATGAETFFYDGSIRLSRLEMKDSSQTTYSRYDSLYYNTGSGNLQYVYRIDVGSSAPADTTELIYNGSGQITRINATGDNGGSFWGMSHDITYNGSGQITDIILDQSSVAGSPEGIVGSYLNMVWSNGNVVNVDLVNDFGAGVVTVELTAIYDTKNNLERHFVLDEAGDLILHYCANNLLELTLDNNEPGIGNSGDKAMEKIYTYNTNNEVATMTNVPALFEDNNSTDKYLYDCSATIGSIVEGNMRFIYPNPVRDKLNVSNLKGVNQLQIINVAGKVVYSESVNSLNHSINIANYSKGIYLLRINAGNEITTHKFIKE
jgi:hypothetical protein